MQEEHLNQESLSEEEKRSSPTNWVKRFGFAGFMFFLIKGLLWLIVPALAAYFAWL